ncbi:MsnO8 family LLM class oxidoreductase [Flavobacteriaceae bacterium Ap0902]|nr:MsnO8 family LLM class oxidoreductase [Flavobacteriaceae bacterium Ap0902]
MKIKNTPLSILDLSLVREGHDFAQAFRDSVDYIRFAEELGFKRFWVAEHHNAKGIASSATAVLIGYLAEKTSTIRVGSGGIMLPNHSTLQVAEAFGTLETMYPDRIDLGLGRAPGTDGQTAAALRRNNPSAVDDYPQEVAELIQYLEDKRPESKVNAYPGVGTKVPIWILGSSPYSAHLAAYYGLPYAFASHFAPAYLETASKIYREEFQPSAYLDNPYFMPAANVIVAEKEEQAQYLSTSYLQMAQNIVLRKSGKLQPPVENMDAVWQPGVKEAVQQMRKYSFVGTAKTVRKGLENLIDLTDADEVMLTSYFYDPKDRENSFRLLKGERS